MTPQGRVRVDPCLRWRENCFAAGDAGAYVRGAHPLRMSVQFAITQGEAAAGNIFRQIHGQPLRPYRPFDPGYIVPMANNHSCGLILGAPLTGRLPTLLHYALCAYRMPGPSRQARIASTIPSILR